MSGELRPPVDTLWISFPGKYTARCVTRGSRSWLLIENVGPGRRPARPRPGRARAERRPARRRRQHRAAAARRARPRAGRRVGGGPLMPRLVCGARRRRRARRRRGCGLGERGHAALEGLDLPARRGGRLVQRPTCASPTSPRTGSGGSTSGPRRRQPVDCFYLYPSIPGNTTNMKIDETEKRVAIIQAARFGQACRVFAPMYRQSPNETAYADSLAAWRDYLAHYNKGRGFVLIGHSQGAYILQRLISEQIEGSPALRKLLVSAILLGSSVTVKKGSDTGGTFRRHPGLPQGGRRRGCVVAYSSWDRTPPKTRRSRTSAARRSRSSASTPPIRRRAARRRSRRSSPGSLRRGSSPRRFRWTRSGSRSRASTRRAA